jgi:hypothetical protein
MKGSGVESDQADSGLELTMPRYLTLSRIELMGSSTRRLSNAVRRYHC